VQHATDVGTESDDALARNEARFRRAFSHAPFGMVVESADGRLLEVNEAFAAMLGHTPAALIGRHEDELVVDDDPAQVLEWTDAGEPDVVVTDRRYRHADGHVVQARCTSRMEHLPGGRIEGRLTHVADLTRLRAAEDALATSEARFRRAFDESPIGMGLSSADGRLLWVNDAFCVLLDRTWAEVVGRRAEEFTHPDDLIVAGRITRRLLAGETTRAECEMRYVRPDGSMVWARLSMSILSDPDDGGPSLVLGQVLDITAAREAEARLAHQASHDALTGLPNRMLLLDRLGQALYRRERAGNEVVVLFLDLDDFKIVNDGLGHGAGDELLVEAAHRLRQCVRPTDTVARLGGDEFVMVCEIDRVHQVAALCDRVAAVLGAPFDLGGKSLSMSASIGVVVVDDSASPAELLRDADVAMYRSKADGRGRSTLFTEGLRAEAVERLEQEADLRVALREGQLTVHYQPVISSVDGRVHGAEALVRWDHPERGLLPPKDFLPAAERSGMIVDVGAFVLTAACRQLGEWQAAGLDLTVSINVSPRQLLDGNVVDRVLSGCIEAGADPRGLVLELTENALIETLSSAGERLRPLRRAGVGVALDDFGTGYSSLQYLRDLPVDMVKIDRTFVRGLGSEDDGALAEAIVRLGSALELTTVAEGIEHQGQLDRLRAMGCDYVQGYLLGHPAPAGQLDLTSRW
jgi:diguanylate cyclase (GGDEF)-like protein/PAS domain S-box-containing protein